MKKLMFLFVAAIMFVAFSACNKYEKQIVGTWTKTVLSTTLSAEFTDGGAINLVYGAYSSNGVYSIDDNELSITTNDCTPVGKYTMAIDGDVLTLVQVSDDCLVRKDLMAGIYNKN